MTEVPPCPAKSPCGTCPYRRDVPAGIWDKTEYEKLPRYDGSILDQVLSDAGGLFMCHQQNGHLCSGWVGCHDMRDNLAVRLQQVDPSTFDYESPVALFASGAEAAAHGMSEIDEPGRRARTAIDKIQRRRGEA